MTRVLVVDDEIDTLNLLRTILEISGFQPVVTLNSVDAITLAEVEHPDVILLDIMMPQLDGFTLCKMMRVNPATMNLPIVFVTAYSSLDLEDRRKEAGADMVLPKPIGMDTLIDAVEKVTSLRSTKTAVQPTPATVESVPVASAPSAMPGTDILISVPTVTDTQESKAATSIATPSTDGKTATTPAPDAKPSDTDGKTAAIPTPDAKPTDSLTSTPPKTESPVDVKPTTAAVPVTLPTEKKDL